MTGNFNNALISLSDSLSNISLPSVSLSNIPAPSQETMDKIYSNVAKTLCALGLIAGGAGAIH